MKRSISVFFPCYNEEDNVETTVTKALGVLKAVAETYEVIVVNDGSADRTLAIAQELAREYQQVKVVSHEKNRGYGVALRTGFKNAQYELVCFTDADGQFDFGEIQRFLPLAEKYDAVLGYRQKRQDKFQRKVNTFFYKMAVDFLFGLGVRDIDCAFKMFKKEIISKIKIEADGAVASAEMLIKFKRIGGTYTEIGVSHYPRLAGNPTGARPGVILKAMRELLNLRKRLKKNGKK